MPIHAQTMEQKLCRELQIGLERQIYKVASAEKNTLFAMG
jgi:hypothetical protein